jgi:hypothetical protein
MACFVALQVLVTKVQNGKMSIDQYLDSLRKRLVADQNLAVALQQRNRAAEAAQVAFPAPCHPLFLTVLLTKSNR